MAAMAFGLGESAPNVIPSPARWVGTIGDENVADLRASGQPEPADCIPHDVQTCPLPAKPLPATRMPSARVKGFAGFA